MGTNRPGYQRERYHRLKALDPLYGKKRYRADREYQIAYKRRKNATPQGKENMRRAALRKHGLTVAEYDSLVLKQKGRCAICRSPDPGRTQSWQVDHNHATGAFRGLLCNLCNLGLGAFHDKPKLLRGALRYLTAAETTS